MLELKVAQFLPKEAKMYPTQFYLKINVFQNSPTVIKYFGYSLMKLVTQNFQKSPNLVTLVWTWDKVQQGFIATFRQKPIPNWTKNLPWIVSAGFNWCLIGSM